MCIIVNIFTKPITESILKTENDSMNQIKIKLQVFCLAIIFMSCAAFKEANLISATTAAPKAEINIKGGSPTSNTLTEAQIRKEVIDFGKQFEGLRYRSGGKEPTTGFDCSGFTGYLMSNFDISLSESSSTQIQDGKNKELKNVQPGDLVFFARSENSRIFHVAMVIDNTDEGITVIHSTCSNGVIETNISKDPYWSSKSIWARDVISQ